MNCDQDGCDRKSRARGMCEMHYGRLKRKGLGEVERSKPKQASLLERLAQEGRNRCCVDCGDVTLFGGMRCLKCFRARAHERKKAAA